MSNLFKSVLAVLTLTFLITSAASAQKTGTSKYKCMIQMTNYVGEGAYIIVSLVDTKGAYAKTLYVMGPNKKWYNTLKEWHKFNTKKPSNISAITGASVAGGDRTVRIFEIENNKIDAGFKLRFESAVEDKEYHVKDLEIPLTTEALSSKNEGSGFIRYVRFSPD
jgi:hypothetical protein